MRPSSLFLCLLGSLASTLPLPAAPQQPATEQAAVQTAPSGKRADYTQSVVRVSVTAQSYDFSRPWSKRAPGGRRALGTVIEGGRVLVTAECVANATYIEIETADGERKQAASVECVDYEADLALLKPDAADFVKTIPSAAFTTPQMGDALSVVQLEPNGNPLVSKGSMTTAEVVRYPIDDSSLLAGRLNVPLQIRESTLSLPVFKEGKLAGLMLRYDSQSGLLDFIPSVVIEHFLKDAMKTPYEGFPRMGCSFAVTRDPQLRRYLGLSGNNGGVLITQVMKGGPADKAGLLKGDVLLEIGGQPIDSDGNYKDPAYGRISLGYLVSTKHFEGEKLKVHLFRGGKEIDAEVPVAKKRVDQYLSEPYIIDRAPNYFVLGGLVLQELSRQYLKEFGADWPRKAPLDLVHLDRTQGESDQEVPGRIVVLTRVLPSDVTIGYEDLRHIIVKKVNGKEIHGLQDIPGALTAVTNGLHRIELNSEPTVIFLDAKAVEAVGPRLQQSFGIPALSRLE